jgi:excisionase family DNA binding protein
MMCGNLLCTIDLVKCAYAHAQKDTGKPSGEFIIEGTEHMCYYQPKPQENAMNEPSTVGQPTIEPLLVTVEEAARLLHIGRSMIYELMNRGEIPSLRIGSARRIPVGALRAWIAARIGSDQLG